MFPPTLSANPQTANRTPVTYGSLAFQCSRIAANSSSSPIRMNASAAQGPIAARQPCTS